MGFNPKNCKNPYNDPATIRSIIEGRMNVEKYLERREVKIEVDGTLSHKHSGYSGFCPLYLC